MTEDKIHDLAIIHLEKRITGEESARELALLYRETVRNLTAAFNVIEADEALLAEALPLDAIGFALLHRYSGESAVFDESHAKELSKLSELGYLSGGEEGGKKYTLTEKGKRAMKALLKANEQSQI